LDLRLAFVTAALMALATILIRAVFGKKVAAVVTLIGVLSLLLPLILIIVSGVTGMLNAAPDTEGKVSSDTITAIMNYVANNLPGLVISAIAGAGVGFLVSLIKKATPKKVRKKVSQRMRLS